MGIEAGHFGWKDPETRVEGLGQLRRTLDALLTGGIKGTIENLENMLLTEPQRDKNGKLRYLLTSGLAVELVTGFEREHHDLDLVIMDPNNTEWEMFGTDNVTPGQYWAGMRFNPQYLEETARKVSTRINGGLVVEVVHPAILIVQKSSDAFDRVPRKKDTEDVKALIGYWEKGEPNPKQWPPIIAEALRALPSAQLPITRERLKKSIDRHH